MISKVSRIFRRTDAWSNTLSGFGSKYIRQTYTPAGVLKVNGYSTEDVANLPYFELTNLNTTNCNDSAAGTQMTWWNIVWYVNSNNELRNNATDGITLNENVQVQAMCNMYFEANTAAVCIWIEFTINWVSQWIRGTSWYIRNALGVNESSVSISQILQINNWQKIWVIMYQMAVSGTVTAVAGKSNLSIKVIN